MYLLCLQLKLGSPSWRIVTAPVVRQLFEVEIEAANSSFAGFQFLSTNTKILLDTKHP